MEEIGQDGRSGGGTCQPLRLEGLDLRFADPLGLGVQQPAPGAGHGVGHQRALERLGLQQDRQAREAALGRRRRTQGFQRRPELLANLRGDDHAFTRQDAGEPVAGPDPLAQVVHMSERLKGDRAGDIATLPIH